MKHGSKLDSLVWQWYAENPDAFMAECLNLLQHALLQANKQDFHPAPLASDRYSPLETATKLILDKHNPEGGEREATTIQRINQSYFRNSLPLNYQYTCCITGMQIPAMPIASHIKPWKASTPTGKTAASNGLLLNAFHDRAFDQGLISIDDDHRIMVNHDKVRHSPVNDQWLYAFEDQRITLPQSANLRMNLSRTTTNTYFSPKLHSHRDNPFPTHSTLPGDIEQIALRLFLPKHQSCPQVALPA